MRSMRLWPERVPKLGVRSGGRRRRGSGVLGHLLLRGDRRCRRSRRSVGQIALGRLDFDFLPRLGDFALEFVLGFVEFADGLSGAAGEFRQPLGPEKDQNDNQENPSVLANEIANECERVHDYWSNSTESPRLQRTDFPERMVGCD